MDSTYILFSAEYHLRSSAIICTKTLGSIVCNATIVSRPYTYTQYTNNIKNSAAMRFFHSISPHSKTKQVVNPNYSPKSYWRIRTRNPSRTWHQLLLQMILNTKMRLIDTRLIAKVATNIPGHPFEKLKMSSTRRTTISI